MSGPGGADDLPAGLTVVRIFVYGTLMPGRPLWPALRPFARSWARASARGWLWDTGYGYPAARFDESGGDIPGVLVEAAGEVLPALDRVEGEGVLFRRVEVASSAGPAFSYEWLGETDGFVLLPDGWAD